MTVTTYTATVKYPASPEPYDAGYGPSHNVRLVFDDPSAPKTDGDGEGNIYKKASSRDAKYMLTLSAGDKVQLVYTDNDGKAWYDFIVPSGYAPPEAPPPAQTPVQAVTRGPVAIEWAEPDDTFWTIWERALDMEYKKMDRALERSVAMMEVDKEFTHDDSVRIALAIYNKASVHAKPGLVLHTEPDEYDRETSVLLLVDSNDMVNSLLDAIVSSSDGFYSLVGLKNLLKSLGLTSKDIVDQDSCLLVIRVAFEYADMLNAGAEENVALTAVANNHDLMAF
jgi:hypothetical protein